MKKTIRIIIVTTLLFAVSAIAEDDLFFLTNKQYSDSESHYILRGHKAIINGKVVTGTQGLFWGCRPGQDMWEQVDCMDDCMSIEKRSIGCSSVCAEMRKVIGIAYPFCAGPGGLRKTLPESK